jgi:hypothetical protein
MTEEKPHWERLRELLKQYENGELTLKFQDGLPVLVLEIRGEKNNIDLTKMLA